MDDDEWDAFNFDEDEATEVVERYPVQRGGSTATELLGDAVYNKRSAAVIGVKGVSTYDVPITTTTKVTTAIQNQIASMVSMNLDGISPAKSRYQLRTYSAPHQRGCESEKLTK